MEKIIIPENLKALVNQCKSPLYVVGGFVRNQLKGLPVSDIDLCGPVAADKLEIDPHYQVRIVNSRLGTAIITDGKSTFEYTPFRIENYEKGGSHTPVSVYFTTDIRQDASRRDFCANTVYWDLNNNKLIDFFDGVRDIQRGILRELPYPARVFTSDGLRLMRLARLAAELGFDIDDNTLNGAKRFAFLIKDISKERIAQELMKILTADFKYGVKDAHYRGLKLLGTIGLWKFIMPEIEDMAGVKQNPSYHKYDVYEHTMQTVKFSPIAVRLAALMHDIGKPFAMKKDGNMHAHNAYGERITRFALGPVRLKLSNHEIEETAWLVANHMYDLDGKTSEAKVRLFVAANMDKIDKLCMLIKADIRGAGLSTPPAKHRFELVKEEILAKGIPTRIADLKINGADAEAAGLKGEDIGKNLQALLRECILNPPLNNREWLLGRLKIAADALTGQAAGETA